ncbi:hypothetical protein [Pacificimonas flava]|nr:hypothetical protein [Pacificimonas flava]MBB5281792.1 hypothetical protein [Pacificimonas flava]
MNDIRNSDSFSWRRFIWTGLASGALALGAPALGQQRDAESSEKGAVQPNGLEQLGRTSQSVAGELGERQTVANTPANTEPMARINNRISNRIESRIENRIDRTYEEASSATGAFVAAGARTRQEREVPR